MLSNKVVFLAQRYSKFKEMFCGIISLAGKRGAGEIPDPPLFQLHDTFTPRGPSPALAVFSFFQRRLINHYGADSECHRGRALFPWVSDVPDCGSVSVFVRAL